MVTRELLNLLDRDENINAAAVVTVVVIAVSLLAIDLILEVAAIAIVVVAVAVVAVLTKEMNELGIPLSVTYRRFDEKYNRILLKNSVKTCHFQEKEEEEDLRVENPHQA